LLFRGSNLQLKHRSVVTLCVMTSDCGRQVATFLHFFSVTKDIAFIKVISTSYSLRVYLSLSIICLGAVVTEFNSVHHTQLSLYTSACTEEQVTKVKKINK
jgi:hypothetical protein